VVGVEIAKGVGVGKTIDLEAFFVEPFCVFFMAKTAPIAPFSAAI